MRLVVPVKYVPEPTATWKFRADLTLDRESVEGRLSELDEYAVEQAVRLLEAGKVTEFTVLTVGPAKAVDAVRKALAMGGTAGVHVLDEAVHGSDALATSRVIARAVERIGFDLVLCGMSSTDAEMSVVPAMVAERLSVAHLTFAAALSVDPAAGVVTVRRDGDLASEDVAARLPAVVSVTDQSGEPRYPSFKAIMGARKKPVTTWSLKDLDLDAAEVGTAAARVCVTALDRRPPRQAGPVVVDDGDAAVQLGDFLAGRGLL
jgi:electron transfer flavoprotein beta subunit